VSLILRAISESISPVARRCVVIAKQPAVKRYIVTLGADERERLTTLIQKGTSPARQVLKARILLKADASEAGEAWSDGQIAEALDTSIDTIARTRQQLVEEGLDAALIRKRSPNSARKRIFRRCCRGQVDRAACSPPPKGRKRWTLVVTQAPVLSPAASAARGIWRADPDRRQRALMVRGQISVFGNSPRSSCWATTPRRQR